MENWVYLFHSIVADVIDLMKFFELFEDSGRPNFVAQSFRFSYVNSAAYVNSYVNSALTKITSTILLISFMISDEQ